MTKEQVIEDIQIAPKLDKQGRAYATGKRKRSIARVWIKKGKGSFTINGVEHEAYLKRKILANIVVQSLEVTELLGKLDIVSTVKGGGLSGQAGAVLLGISRSLVALNPELRKILRDNGFMTRDSRIVERKKSGLKKARKARTYRKR